MEALAELYDVTGRDDVRESLIEAVNLTRHYFFPLDPALAVGLRNPDWTTAPLRPISYGGMAAFASLQVCLGFSAKRQTNTYFTLP